jgi:lipoprotein LprG
MSAGVWCKLLIMITRSYWKLLWLFLLVVPLLACQQAEPEPELSPEMIVAETAVRLGELSGFHFVMETSGPAAYLDATGTLALRRLEGDFVAPDRVRAVVRVAVPGLVTEVRVIRIGDQQWQTNVLTGAWEPLPPSDGLNPANLFNEATGLPAVLAQDLSEISLVGSETVDGVVLEVITAVVAPQRLASMSSNLIAAQPTDDPITIRLWLEPESRDLYRLLLTEPLPNADEPRIWQVDLSQFDQTVTIEPPILPES